MNATRRGLFQLSAAAVGVLAGARARRRQPADIQILNVALGLEWEGIHAYTLGAQSGLLKKPVLETAVRFQADHKEHAETLAGAIRRMGGKPVESKSLAEYAKALNADRLKTQKRRARPGGAPGARRAANAYLGVIPSFSDRELARVAARLAADEVMHWTILNSALGRPLPAGGMPSARDARPAVRLRGACSPHRAGGFFSGARGRRRSRQAPLREPLHRGVFGSKAGSVAGFEYSPALSASSVIWSEKTLGRWLADPEKVVPGQKMGFSVSEPADRADIIENLRAA